MRKRLEGDIGREGQSSGMAAIPKRFSLSSCCSRLSIPTLADKPACLPA